MNKMKKSLIVKTSSGFQVYKVSGGTFQQQLNNGIKVTNIELVKDNSFDKGSFRKTTKQRFRVYTKKS